MGADGIHLRVPREMAVGIANPLATIYEMFWWNREVGFGDLGIVYLFSSPNSFLMVYLMFITNQVIFSDLYLILS